MSLDVETKEKGLQIFYAKQGFKQKGGPYKQEWTEKDTGKKIEINVFYLEKQIE